MIYFIVIAAILIVCLTVIIYLISTSELEERL